MIDPYLSDIAERVNPNSYRRLPMRKELFDIEPDIMIFTHDHTDHFDPETASQFLIRQDKPITVLSPVSVWQRVRAYGGIHN